MAVECKPVTELPSFYRLRFVWGRRTLVTLKGEVIREVPDASREEIEALARAHDQVRHWSMIVRESKSDSSDGGRAFTDWAEEKLRVARWEFKSVASGLDGSKGSSEGAA